LFITRYATTLGKLVTLRRTALHVADLSTFPLPPCHFLVLKAVETKDAERFTASQICKWMLEIATGLDFLKKHKIIHRYWP